MNAPGDSKEKGLADLPIDELRSYALGLGIEVAKNAPRADILRLVRQRRELLLELDRQAMLDVVVWARIPVRRSASKEQLARLIATIDQVEFAGLSHRGLVAVARLRGLEVGKEDTDEQVAAAMKKRDGLWSSLRRRRRRLSGWLVDQVIADQTDKQAEYQFLPEDPRSPEAILNDRMEHRGVVRGIAGRLRNVADDYIAEKLDEIEKRIDQKLDEIDARLAEWRDREITNRLKIIKITLVASVVVAVLSLGYKYVSSRVGAESPTSQPAQGSLTRGVSNSLALKRLADLLLSGGAGHDNSPIHMLLGADGHSRQTERTGYASKLVRT
ncbi:MAG: hypothetical protein JXQ73_09755 [Phycisphaerae bacterium]|nr:hypothetical protein [Phycisphaerae bacterium]